VVFQGRHLLLPQPAGPCVFPSASSSFSLLHLVPCAVNSGDEGSEDLDAFLGEDEDEDEVEDERLDDNVEYEEEDDGHGDDDEEQWHGAEDWGGAELGVAREDEDEEGKGDDGGEDPDREVLVRGASLRVWLSMPPKDRPWLHVVVVKRCVFRAFALGTRDVELRALRPGTPFSPGAWRAKFVRFWAQNVIVLKWSRCVPLPQAEHLFLRQRGPARLATCEELSDPLFRACHPSFDPLSPFSPSVMRLPVGALLSFR